MTIPLIKEPECIGPSEGCHFCRRSTRHWHENTNNPVCPSCAKKHRVSELPDYGVNVRASKRKNRTNH